MAGGARKSTAANNKKSKGFTDEEKAAMKECAKELKAEARANKNKAEGESALLAKIAEMPEPERAMAKRLHVSSYGKVVSPVIVTGEQRNGRATALRASSLLAQNSSG